MNGMSVRSAHKLNSGSGPPAAKPTKNWVARSGPPVVTEELSSLEGTMLHYDRVCAAEKTTSSSAKRGPPAEFSEPPEGLLKHRQRRTGEVN